MGRGWRVRARQFLGRMMPCSTGNEWRALISAPLQGPLSLERRDGRGIKSPGNHTGGLFLLVRLCVQERSAFPVCDELERWLTIEPRPLPRYSGRGQTEPTSAYLARRNRIPPAAIRAPFWRIPSYRTYRTPKGRRGPGTVSSIKALSSDASSIPSSCTSSACLFTGCLATGWTPRAHETLAQSGEGPYPDRRGTARCPVPRARRRLPSPPALDGPGGRRRLPVRGTAVRDHSAT